MEDKKLTFPVCGAPGTGPYARYVLNDRKRRFEPYYYFAHKGGGRVKWCYLKRSSSRSYLTESRQTKKRYLTSKK